jgi:membrane-associated phospholipid phosphatase
MTPAAVGRDRMSVNAGRAQRPGRALLRLLGAAVVLWGLMCGLGYLLTTPLHDTAFERWDGAIDRLLARHRDQPWTTATHLLTYGAETYTVAAVGLIFFVGMRLHLKRWHESLFLLAAVVGEVSIFVCTTLIIDRHRPNVPHLDAAPPTSSFPSGHTAAALTLYGALAIIAVHARARRWLRVAAVLVALLAPVLVACARMYRGMHYPTDVLGGALLAVLWLTVCWAVVLRQRR